MTNTETIQSLIDSGEGYNVEFKVRVPSIVRELTEEICAFANADGGYLLIGVDDNGQIIGTGLENDKRSAIQGSISEISPALHCDMYAVNIEDKTVWVIDVPSGKDKPYITKMKNRNQVDREMKFCTMVHRETFMICVSERVRKAGIRLSPYLR